MRTLTQYEVAWNMHRAGSPMPQICQVVGKHRATIYRWLIRIRRLGIRAFVAGKQVCKRRRQPTKVSDRIAHLIRDIRRERGWCGQKIQKELAEKHGIRLCLMTVYRILRRYFVFGGKTYKKRGVPPRAANPRQVIQHDTVDFGKLFAYTAIDIFTKEPSVYIGTSLKSEEGCRALAYHMQYYRKADLQQSDEGSEFLGYFPQAVRDAGSAHHYARAYKKNDQCFIENLNKAFRKECAGWGKYQVSDRAELQAKAEVWCQHYITERWHMGLPQFQTPLQYLQDYTEQRQEYTWVLESSRVAFGV